MAPECARMVLNSLVSCKVCKDHQSSQREIFTKEKLTPQLALPGGDGWESTSIHFGWDALLQLRQLRTKQGMLVSANYPGPSRTTTTIWEVCYKYFCVVCYTWSQWEQEGVLHWIKSGTHLCFLSFFCLEFSEDMEVSEKVTPLSLSCKRLPFCFQQLVGF